MSVLDMERGSELALSTEVLRIRLVRSISSHPRHIVNCMHDLPDLPELHDSQDVYFLSIILKVEGFWLSDNLPGQASEPTVSTTASNGSTLSRLTGQGRSSGGGDGGDGGTSSSSQVEMPWWAYGPRGVQLWFPSALSDPLSPRQLGAQQHDIELEFDQEVRNSTAGG